MKVGGEVASIENDECRALVEDIKTLAHILCQCPICVSPIFKYFGNDTMPNTILLRKVESVKFGTFVQNIDIV